MVRFLGILLALAFLPFDLAAQRADGWPIVRIGCENTCFGDTVRFINATIGADRYEWDFADGSPVSTEVAPTHFYAQPGTYRAKLRATNDTGTSVGEALVSVYPRAVGGLLASDSIVRGWRQIELRGMFSGGEIELFELGDGSERVYDPRTVNVYRHTYKRAGTFYPSMRVRMGSDCRTIGWDTVVVEPSLFGFVIGDSGDCDVELLEADPFTGATTLVERTTTDSTGRFAFVTNRRHVYLRATPRAGPDALPSYHPAATSIHEAEAIDLPRDISHQRNIVPGHRIAIDDSALTAVSVLIVDRHGNPVEGLRLIARGDNGDLDATTTGADGRAQVTTFTDATRAVRLIVDDIGHSPEDALVVLPDWNEHPLHFADRRLSETTPESKSMIAGFVRSRSGEPMRSGRVELVRYDSAERVVIVIDSATIGVDGSYEIPVDRSVESFIRVVPDVETIPLQMTTYWPGSALIDRALGVDSAVDVMNVRTIASVDTGSGSMDSYLQADVRVVLLADDETPVAESFDRERHHISLRNVPDGFYRLLPDVRNADREHAAVVIASENWWWEGVGDGFSLEDGRLYMWMLADAPHETGIIVSALSISPNPAAEEVVLAYALERSSMVGIDLYRPDGTHVSTVLHGARPSGPQNERIDLRGLSAGAYVLVVKHDKHVIGSAIVRVVR